MCKHSVLACAILLPLALLAQTAGQAGSQQDQQTPGWRRADDAKQAGGFVVPVGTKIPLSLINSISTKNSAEGDRVYLETVFPILANGRIVIPPGSYVMGTITEVKRPGRIKGRGELYLRFDSLTLPNGVTRDFRARVGSLDGSVGDELDREEGKIRSETNKSGDARTVGETAATGASIGAIAGSVADHPGLGVGIGAAAGAAAGLMGVLLTRGPDIVLSRGTTLEMVLDRPVSYTTEDVDFSGARLSQPQSRGVGAIQPSGGGQSTDLPRLNRRGTFWPY
jgi:type IV secretion system protein VirB10